MGPFHIWNILVGRDHKLQLGSMYRFYTLVYRPDTRSSTFSSTRAVLVDRIYCEDLRHMNVWFLDEICTGTNLYYLYFNNNSRHHLQLKVKWEPPSHVFFPQNIHISCLVWFSLFPITEKNHEALATFYEFRPSASNDISSKAI